MKPFISYVIFAYQSTFIGRDLVLGFAVVYCLFFVSVLIGFWSSNRFVVPQLCSTKYYLYDVFVGAS